MPPFLFTLAFLATGVASLLIASRICEPRQDAPQHEAEVLRAMRRKMISVHFGVIK
jgi:hypothetical protein